MFKIQHNALTSLIHFVQLHVYSIVDYGCKLRWRSYTPFCPFCGCPNYPVLLKTFSFLVKLWLVHVCSVLICTDRILFKLCLVKKKVEEKKKLRRWKESKFSSLVFSTLLKFSGTSRVDFSIRIAKGYSLQVFALLCFFFLGTAPMSYVQAAIWTFPILDKERLHLSRVMMLPIKTKKPKLFLSFVLKKGQGSRCLYGKNKKEESLCWLMVQRAAFFTTATANESAYSIATLTLARQFLAILAWPPTPLCIYDSLLRKIPAK